MCHLADARQDLHGDGPDPGNGVSEPFGHLDADVGLVEEKKQGRFVRSTTDQWVGKGKGRNGKEKGMRKK